MALKQFDSKMSQNIGKKEDTCAFLPGFVSACSVSGLQSLVSKRHCLRIPLPVQVCHRRSISRLTRITRT